jgi:hypothetical protein
MRSRVTAWLSAILPHPRGEVTDFERRQEREAATGRESCGRAGFLLLDHPPALREAESFDGLFQVIAATIGPIPVSASWLSTTLPPRVRP